GTRWVPRSPEERESPVARCRPSECGSWAECIRFAARVQAFSPATHTGSRISRWDAARSRLGAPSSLTLVGRAIVKAGTPWGPGPAQTRTCSHAGITRDADPLPLLHVRGIAVSPIEVSNEHVAVCEFAPTNALRRASPAERAQARLLMLATSA